MGDFTGNISSACWWCGDNHGPQWQCSHDMLRQMIGALRGEIERLEAELATTRDAVRLAVGRQRDIPWTDVRDSDVDSYVVFVSSAARKAAGGGMSDVPG